MIFVFGGKYQGKLDFVKEKFNISDDEVLNLKEEDIDYDKKVFYHIEAKFRDLDISKLQDKIVIADDLNTGIVPIDDKLRLDREDLGRFLVKISKNSDEVYRIFLGLNERLK